MSIFLRLDEGVRFSIINQEKSIEPSHFNASSLVASLVYHYFWRIVKIWYYLYSNDY